MSKEADWGLRLMGALIISVLLLASYGVIERAFLYASNSTAAPLSPFDATIFSSFASAPNLAPPTSTTPTTTLLNTTSIPTTVPPGNASAATNTTSSSTTSSTTSTSGALDSLSASVTNATLAYRGGKSIGSVVVRGAHARIKPTNSFLKELKIDFNATGLNANFSIENQSQKPNDTRGFLGATYQYIRVNGTANNKDIDNYVTNATYNFTVSAAWLQQNGASPSSVALYKYLPDGPDWVELPTSLIGGNSTNYFYSATSSSLSSYVIGFATSTKYVSGTSATTSLGLSTTYNTFFFAAAGSGARAGSTTAFSTNFIQITSNEVAKTTGSSSTHFANVVVIGYNSEQFGGGTGTENGNMVMPTGYTNYNVVWAGISANVIFNNNAVEVNTVTTAAGTTNSLSFTVSAGNSVVFLLYASAGNVIKSVKLPDKTGNGCTAATIKSDGTNGLASVAVANCLVQSTGTFTTNFLQNAGAVYHANAIVAIVFPPYNVLLRDTPVNGNIVTNFTANGKQVPWNAIGVIGGPAPMNALPFGTNTFTSWAVDSSNAANIILTSTVTNQILTTVMGNAIIIASFSGTAVNCAFPVGWICSP